MTETIIKNGRKYRLVHAPNIIAERILDRIRISETTECWNFTGKLDRDGYGRMRYNGSNPRLLHRISYQAYRGNISKGLTIDHLCRNRKCCNPEHLEAVPLLTNIKRGGNTIKTHCTHGHEFGENNFYNYNGRRRCKNCESSRRKTARLSCRPVRDVK